MVLVGFQCWFVENLRATHYANGDPIPAALPANVWSTTTEGATAVFGEGSSNCNESSPDGDACDEGFSEDAYGRLYNWYAVDDPRGLCPTGWHVPTDQDFQHLEQALGMPVEALAETGWRGTTEGDQLKATTGWFAGGNGTDASGLGAAPGGSRLFFNGQFTNAGSTGYLWADTPSGASYGYYRRLSFNESRVYRGATFVRTGYSVRCVQDPLE